MIDHTKLSLAQKVLDEIRKYDKVSADPDVPFEYLVGSCFPSVLKNVQDAINKAYQHGYDDAMKDWKNLNSNEN